MSGGLKTNRGGFTIVEVMIVLAVTGLIFLMAVFLIEGRQGGTQFALAANEIETQIQQVAGDVANGYYPNDNNFSCANTNNPLGGAVAGQTQGTNEGCIFLGKVMEFSATGTNSPAVNVYTIIANQNNSAGQPTQNLNDPGAAPELLEPAIPPAGVTPPVINLENGLTVYSMACIGAAPCSPSPGNPIAALAFVANPNTNQISSGNGGQVSVAAITGTTLGSTTTSQINSSLSSIASGAIDPSGGIQICFASGSSNESALMQIGGSNRSALVTMNVHTNDRTC